MARAGHGSMEGEGEGGVVGGGGGDTYLRLGTH